MCSAAVQHRVAARSVSRMVVAVVDVAIRAARVRARHLLRRSCLQWIGRVRLSGGLRRSYRARWIRNTQLTDVPPGPVEIGAAVRARGASDADARSGLEVSRRARPDVHRAHRDLTHLIRMPLGRLRRLRPAGDRLRERRAVLPKITPQAQLCQQLQLRIELNPSQMAAESMLHRHGADRRHHGRRPGPSPR